MNKKAVKAQKRHDRLIMPFLYMLSEELFLCEEILSLRLLNEKLVEYVSTSLWRLVHADTLNHLLECTSLEGCDCFLCHFLFLLNYLISR